MKLIQSMAPLVFWILLSLAAFVITKDQYPGYDASMMVNAGYQNLLMASAREGESFTPLPPLFVLGSAWAMKFFGLNWSSFIWLGVGVYSLCSFVFFRLCRFTQDRAIALALTGSVFASTAVFYGFWWHNTVSALTAGLACLAYFHLDKTRVCKWAFILFCALSLCGKVNLGLPIVLGLVAHMSLPKKMGGQGRDACVPILLIAVLSLLIFGAAKISPWVYIESLVAISEKRASYTFLFTSPSGPVEQYAFTSSWIALSLTGLLFFCSWVGGVNSGLVNGIKEPLKFRFKKIWLLTLIGCGSFLGLYLNGDYAHCTLPLLLSGVAIASDHLERGYKKMARFGVLSTSLVLILFLTLGGVKRDRVYTTGPGAFWAPDALLITPMNGFFAGSAIGPELALFISETEEVLTARPTKKVFFGPRVEFGYAAFKIAPPAGLPLWFDRRAAWPGNGETAMVSAFKKAKIELIIFNRNDTTQMPLELVEEIAANYKDITGQLGLNQANVWVRK